MNKKYSTLIGCFFLLVGIAATSCGGEGKNMSERATQFMESMKEGDYEKTAKMWTDRDPEEELDDQQMWIINEIKKELEDVVWEWDEASRKLEDVNKRCEARIAALK